MVVLNGDKPFPVYGIDTQESRFSRVAWMMGTHPIFLRTDPVDLLSIDEKTSVVAEDLYKQILDDAKTSIDFGGFYEAMKDRFTTPFEIVLYTWLTNLPNFEENEGVLILDIESKYPDVNVKTVLEHTNNDQTRTIAQFLQSQSAIEKELTSFGTVVPVEMDKVEVQKITFEVYFKIEIDLVEIFDRLRMSNELPYVNNGPDRHKIYKNFKHLGENWELGDVNAVQFYVLNTKYIPPKFQEKDYSQGIIILSDTPNEAVMAIETVVGMKNSLDNLVNRVFSSLNIDKNKIIKTRQQSVSSIVNIPKQQFNRFLLADIVSNDPFVSSLCFMDESAKVGRIRSGLTFYYQPVGAEEKITISLTEVTAELREFRLSSKLYPLHSRYVRVRINKARDEAMTKEIAIFIGKIFNIYLARKVQIAEMYRRFIPTFVEAVKEAAIIIQTRIGKRLQDLVPQIFVSGYPRKCRKAPEIVDTQVAGLEAKAKDYVIDKFSDEYTQAMLFPKTPDEGPQHWYACQNGMYPGLIANKRLENNDQFPYLPCCYPVDQTGKTNFKNYYLEMGIKDASATFSYVLKTPKFVHRGEKGILPVNLERLLQSFFDTPANFYRTGTSGGPGSFIEAVAMAMGKPVNRRDFSETMFTVCRQNAWDSTSEQLQRAFLNLDEYINPNVYYRALEEYFKCYIYLFTRTADNRGALIHPIHKYAYLREVREPRPAVLIMEHLGSESDAATIPQSEVIMAIDEQTKQPRMNFSGSFVNRIDDMYTATVKWFSGTTSISDVEKKIFKNIVAQGIDSAGKTRTLVVSFQNKEVYILSDPLPPLFVKERSTFRNNEQGLIQSFIEAEDLLKVGVNSDTYVVRKGDLTFQIPYRVVTTSTLGKYNQNQRIARYLQEYAYYLYSIYTKDHGMNPNNINAFLREKTVVKSEYSYPKIPRRFDLNGAYLEGGKLIVQNLEMAQRLGYSIELLMRRQPRKLLEYSSYTLLQDYYLDRNDFTQEQNELILMTDASLRDWADEVPVEYVLHNIPTSQESLFYLDLDGKVVLVQLAASFENAVYIANVWNQSGYNSQSVLTDEKSDYMYYTFESPNRISVHGEAKNKVLVWREEDELKYGAILI